MTIRSSSFGGGGVLVGEFALLSHYKNLYVDPTGREFLRSSVVYVPDTPADYAEALANEQCRAFVTSDAIQASGGSTAWGVASDKNLTIVDILGSSAQRSTDGGQTWTTGIALNLVGGYTQRAIATDGAGNWLVGGNVTAAFNISRSTDNGATWTNVATPTISGSTAASNSLALGWDSKNSLWVAALRNTNAAQCIWTSPDGVTWTARAITTALASNPTISSSALGVLVFDTGNTTNYAYSTNGTTYTTGTLPANKSTGYFNPLMFDTIAYSSGRGTYSTTDLVNWTSVGITTPSGLMDPVFVGGQKNFDVRGGFAYGPVTSGANLIGRIDAELTVEHFHVLLPGGSPLVSTVQKVFPMSNGVMFLFKDSGNYFWYRLDNFFTTANALGSEGAATVGDLAYFLRIK